MQTSLKTVTKLQFFLHAIFVQEQIFPFFLNFSKNFTSKTPRILPNIIVFKIPLIGCEVAYIVTPTFRQKTLRHKQVMGS